MKKILFVSNALRQCGVYQFGKSIYSAISLSREYQFDYVECGKECGDKALIDALHQYSPCLLYTSRLKGQGVDPNKTYWHDIIGYNFRMTNLAAAIGLAQLERVSIILDRKKAIAAAYRKKLAHLPILFQGEIQNSISSHWMVSILVPQSDCRDKLRSFLADLGIETRPVFYPVNEFPMYRTDENFPNAKDLSSRGINLPSFPDLSDDQITYICEKIEEFLCKQKLLSSGAAVMQGAC